MKPLRYWLVLALLLIYPPRWRKEYGPELTHLLLARPMSLRNVIDTAWNALRQRLREEQPWKILGALSCFLNLLALVLDVHPAGYQIIPTLLILLTAACWTVIRDAGNHRRAGGAAVKTALLATSPIVMIGLLASLGVVTTPIAGTSPYGLLILPLLIVPEIWLIGSLFGLLTSALLRIRRGSAS